MTTKTKNIGGISVPVPTDEPQDAYSTTTNKPADKPAVQDSTFVENRDAYRILSRNVGAKRVYQLTPDEEEEIRKDLKHVASAIALYNSEFSEGCADIPLKTFVCFYSAMESAREKRPRKPTNK